MCRGASYADSLRFQRCVDLWSLALQVRVKAHSILHSDTCFTAQALIRLMLDLQEKFVEAEPNNFIDQGLPNFDDVLAIFVLLNASLIGNNELIDIIFNGLCKSH